MPESTPPELDRDHGGDRPTWCVRAAWSFMLCWWTALYVATLGCHGWIRTELSTIRVGRGSFLEMLADRSIHGHCPLYFSGSWLVQQVFGESPFALRLPSALLFLGCVVLVYRLVRRWADRSSALTASILVMLSPLLLELSHQARPYTFTLLIGLAATDVLVAPTPVGGAKRARRFGALSFAGLLTSHSYWFILAAHAVVLLRRPGRQAAMLGSALLACLGALPWFLYAKLWASSDGLSEQFLTWIEPVQAATVVALPGRLLGFDTYVLHEASVRPAIITVAAVALIVVGLARLPGDRLGAGAAAIRPTMAALWLAPPAGALVSGFLGWGNLLQVPRYFVVTATVQLILVAAALAVPRRPLRTVLVAVVAIALAAESLLLMADLARDEMRRAAQIVNAERALAERVHVVGRLRDTKIFRHYAEGPSAVLTVSPSPRRGTLLDPATLRFRVGNQGLWVVIPVARRGQFIMVDGGEVEAPGYLEAVERRYRNPEIRRIGDWELRRYRERVVRPRGRPPRGAPAHVGDESTMTGGGAHAADTR